MYSQRNTYILIAAALLTAFVVGYISYTVHRSAPVAVSSTATSTASTVNTGGTPAEITTQTYTSDTYGITFNYPSSYTLTQRDVKDAKNASNNHHAITLVDSQATPVNNGEGPTAITMDIYPNPKNVAVQDWITTNSNSNYKLAVDTKLQSAQIGGASAYAYTWSGLYNGNSFVFAHKKNIIMVSVTYMTAGDAILNDFTQIMTTLKLR